MFAYDFMVHAFLAATIVSVLAGLCGYFLLLRGQAFASHALAHLGFTGATGAVLVGLPPILGLVSITLLGGIGMGWMGEDLAGRDVAIGMVLAMSLGLGLLFLHFFTAYAAQATSLLFGNVLGIDTTTLWQLLVVGLVSIVALATIARPLLFISLQPEVAVARGVSPKLISTLFLAVVALITAACTQIVGVLLVFTLMIGPAAAALQLTTHLKTGLVFASLLAVLEAWAGLYLAFISDWPVSFWISFLSGAIYIGTTTHRKFNQSK